MVQEGSEMIAITDVVGNYMYGSPTSTAITGIRPEEFLGKNVFEFIYPDDANKKLVRLRKTAIEKKVTIEPLRFPNHQNGCWWYNWY